ncbi:unnamed protein product [Dracunculus medinensis]|uniref:G_PROTEIN_RECEP_F1_2 domain-containing protein n=1 Tax=Dracunculus medinensis TaxID=318479 RepID=A0A0N4UBU2_DRAME|nr:unnamed protein product [Dracunculus medinensis]
MFSNLHNSLYNKIFGINSSILNLTKQFSAVSETHNSAWRKQLRNRVFRTTLLVVIAHILFWFPYNLYALMNYVNVDLYLQMSDHANVFNDLQILITLRILVSHNCLILQNSFLFTNKTLISVKNLEIVHKIQLLFRIKRKQRSTFEF